MGCRLQGVLATLQPGDPGADVQPVPANLKSGEQAELQAPTEWRPEPPRLQRVDLGLLGHLPASSLVLQPPAWPDAVDGSPVLGQGSGIDQAEADNGPNQEPKGTAGPQAIGHWPFEEEQAK